MKSTYVALAALLLFSACQQESETPPTRAEMITNTWVFESVVHTSTENGMVTTNVQDVSNSDYEIELQEGGTLIIRNDGTTLNGTWTFVNDNTLHTTLDVAPTTINSSVITRLTPDEFWLTNTTTSDNNGNVVVTVSEVQHRTKE